MKCRPPGDFIDDWQAFLAQEPACVFMNGACHALAIELADFLKHTVDGNILTLVSFVSENGTRGCHVLVKIGDVFYLDVRRKLLRDADLRPLHSPEKVSESDLAAPAADDPNRHVWESDTEGLAGSNSVAGSLRAQIEALARESRSVSNGTLSRNRFGHRIDASFFNEARRRAKEYIESNGGEFTQLAEQALAIESRQPDAGGTR